MNKNHRLLKKALIIFGAFIVVSLVIYPFHGLQYIIYHRKYEINITTGQGRFSLHLFSCNVYETTYDTYFTQLLKGESVNAFDVVYKWHPDSIFTFTGNSPHCSFHGASQDPKRLRMLTKMFKISEEKARETAIKIMTLWQKTESYYEARRFLIKYTDDLYDAEMKKNTKKSNCD